MKQDRRAVIVANGEYPTSPHALEVLRGAHYVVCCDGGADAYIERVTYDMAKDKRVRVVTADMQEQFIILGNGALRVSPDEFFAELASAEIEIGEMYQAK